MALIWEKLFFVLHFVLHFFKMICYGLADLHLLFAHGVLVNRLQNVRGLVTGELDCVFIRNANGQERGGVIMPQIVKPEARHIQPFDDAEESLGN